MGIAHIEHQWIEKMLIDKLAWIEIKEGKVLVARSKGKDKFYIPGGKRENGESDELAVIREIKEELTVDLLPDSLKYFDTFSAQAHGRPAGVLVQMTCYFGDYTGTIMPDSEIEEVKWLNYHEKDQVAPVDKIIFKDLKEKGLMD